MRNYILLVLFIFCVSFVSNAQNSFEEFDKQTRNDYNSFLKKAKDDYNSFQQKTNEDFEKFRKKANDDYATFLNKTWKNHNALKSPIKEEQSPIPPQPYKKEPIEDRSTPIQQIITPKTVITPQPTPIEPIEEQPLYNETTLFSFFGCNLKVRLGNIHKFTLHNISNASISNAWKKLSTPLYNNVINDCLKIRAKHTLCDWAYLLMLKELANSFTVKGSNEATLLMAYIYSQSGYKMRLATDGNKLYMLYASDHTIYGTTYYHIDNTQFYPFEYDGNNLKICEGSFPNERPLSFNMQHLPLLGDSTSSGRELKSTKHSQANAMVYVNTHLIDFFNTYPSSQIGKNFMTRWAIYANTPLSDNAKNTLYPSLRKAIAGVNQHEAVDRILNFIQTAFNYKSDKNVWGEDRALFADETLFYPYSDCEDRSILFSRLVRDLLELDVALVYYPGHMATAVHFTTDVKGDNFIHNGKKFVICDPTYINALVGAAMPQFRGCKDISVIILD